MFMARAWNETAKIYPQHSEQIRKILLIYFLLFHFFYTPISSDFSPTHCQQNDFSTPKNLSGVVFWNETQEIFQVNLSWIQPHDLTQLQHLKLNYACVPSPCKNHYSERDMLLEKNLTSITIPRIDDNHKVQNHDFISLDSNLRFQLDAMGMNMSGDRLRTTCLGQTTFEYQMPVCLNKRCSCRHMNYLPKINFTNHITNDGKLNVSWEMPEVILYKNDTRFDKVYINVDVKHDNKSIYSETVEKSIFEMERYHYYVTNLTLHNHKKYQISVFFHDKHFCKSIVNKRQMEFAFKESEPNVNTYGFVGGVLLVSSFGGFLITIYCIINVLRRMSKNVLRKKANGRLDLKSIESIERFQLLTYKYSTIYRTAQTAEENRLVQKNYEDKFEIEYDRLIVLNELGHGNFGNVFKGELTDVNQRRVSVAIKQINDENASKLDFLKEIYITKDIEYHPNVIRLLGYCTMRAPFCIVMEYANSGNLLDYLKKLPRKNSLHFNFNSNLKHTESISSKTSERTSILSVCTIETEISSVSSSPKTPLSSNKESHENQVIDTKELNDFARQIANGMAHLEAKNITHRDLAARNILINIHDNVKQLKICDFGLSRHINLQNGVYVTTNTNALVPIKWLSVESIQNGEYSSKSDVWSYGVVLWEIGSLGDEPYAWMNPGNYQELLNFLIDGNRLDQPDLINDELYLIMLKCWSYNSDERPTFTKLSKMFNPINANYFSVNVNSIKREIKMVGQRKNVIYE